MTPRDPHRDTRGGEVIRVSRGLGKEPLPWVRDLLNTAFEVDPATGGLWYSQVVIVVPRQSGKTTTTLPVITHRCLAWPTPQLAVYVAQDGIRTIKKWEEQVTALQASPFRPLIARNRQGEREPVRTNGRQHLEFLTGSQWWPDVPSEEAGHGSTQHLGFVDEYWAQVDNRVEAAMRPTMITVDDAQMWFQSTVGASRLRSSEMWAKMQAGRNAIDSKLKTRTLYIEFSAPEDIDIMDRRWWWRTMPALGYTQSLRKIQDELDQDTSRGHSLFKRSYLNIWPDDTSEDWEIPKDKFVACQDPTSQIPDTADLVWVVDVSPDRAFASISVAARREDGRVHLEVVDHGPGTDWVVDGDDRPSSDQAHLHGLSALVSKWGGHVWFDWQTVGPLAPLIQAAGIDATPVPAAEIRVAAPGLLDAVFNDRVRHLGQRSLTEALAAAKRRTIGDGWGWARGKSLRDISALVSVTLAHRMLVKDMPEWGYDPLSGIY